MQHEPSTHRPSIIPRSDIPLSDAPEDRDFEVRPFGAHALLSEVVPRSDVGMAWIHARHGQEEAMRSHPTRGLLIVLEGSAELVGMLNRRVGPGDAVMIPSGQAYGFREIGPQGLHALHVSFGTGQGAPARGLHSVERLMQRNQARSAMLLQNPFFDMLRDGTLKSESRRIVMRECLRVFSNSFQNFLFLRQSMCREPNYWDLFHEHLQEELGHNDLLTVRGHREAAKDPILHATSTWFCHQMLVQDNVGKVLLNVVLETAGYHFHTLAKPVFEHDESARYFDVHAEGDEKHKDVGVELLSGQHPETYRRLEKVLESGWDTLDAMTRRVAQLVDIYAKSA